MREAVGTHDAAPPHHIVRGSCGGYERRSLDDRRRSGRAPDRASRPDRGFPPCSLPSVARRNTLAAYRRDLEQAQAAIGLADARNPTGACRGLVRPRACQHRTQGFGSAPVLRLSIDEGARGDDPAARSSRSPQAFEILSHAQIEAVARAEFEAEEKRLPIRLC